METNNLCYCCGKLKTILYQGRCIDCWGTGLAREEVKRQIASYHASLLRYLTVIGMGPN